MSLILGWSAVGSLSAYAQAAGWALPRVSVACVREHPGHASELGSQVVMGTPLRVLGQENGWLQVETPERYKGYVIDNSLSRLTDDAMLAWRGSKRWVVVSSDQTYVYALPDADAMNRVTDVVAGCILSDGGCVSDGGEFVRVGLPDGRDGYVLRSDVMDLDIWAERQVTVAEVLEMALSLMGTPYLWGGTSTKAMDCSGLTKLCFFSQGVVLPRNASEQALIGSPVEKSDWTMFESGDLLFFGNAKTGRINHVGMYLDEGRFVHCSGRVKVNSLEKGDPLYADIALLGVRRLSEDTLEELSAARHGWYFCR